MTNNDNRTLTEIANAEIVPGQGGPNEWLMRFGDNDYDFISKESELNRLAVENPDLLHDAEDGAVLTTDDSRIVSFKIDTDSNRYTIRKPSGGTLVVPNRYQDEALSTFAQEDGDGLLELYDRIEEEQVDRNVVNSFADRFDDETVDVRDDGWTIDDTFIVQYNAENYLAEDVTVHVRDGSQTRPADTSKQARELNFNINGEVEASAPDGTRFTLGEKEQRFLATVEVLSDPVEYFGEGSREAQAIENQKEWANDPISAVARSASCRGFTDEKTGLHHGHGLNKHRLGDLGVSQEAIDRLYYNDFDHAGVVELAYRENQFRNADFPVFTDAANNNESKWQKIRNTKDNAPVPERVHTELRRMYGN